jgi:threonyl-tRNA synthetase
MPTNISQKRHSLAHIMAHAIQELYPQAQFAIGPDIDNGWYYDIDFNEEKISEEDFGKLEKRMKELIKANMSFAREEATIDEALAWAKTNNQPYKIELIEGLAEQGEKTVTFYTIGKFKDLCRGGHVESTKEIDTQSFKLHKLAGAYWRGDEHNKMLTRIYGLAFDTKQELEDYLAMLAEAEKRDHRKLGRELDLFTFSELVGAGLPLYTPKGTILRDLLGGYSEELQLAKGFQKVWIPHITKIDLYKKSGHWDKFGDELMLVKSQESSDEFAMKPMNCPHHAQIFASRPRSYRDLPIRYMETTTVYRDEKTGEIGGLTRVRSLTQDDAHVFCTMEQIEQEFENIMSMIKTMYQTFNMSFKARLSFSDPDNMQKYLGDRSQWENAEKTLEDVSKKLKLDYFIALGEAAFYGPKIDIMVTDALGREWQCATEQLDFMQPARFELEYTAEDGTKKTPVMIHKALLGTIDRFLAVYIEHTAGNFPVWVSPVQIKLISVSENHIDFCHALAKEMKEHNIRLEIDSSNESVGKKIRQAVMEKVPYMLVIGDKEMNSEKLFVRERGEQEAKEWDKEEFIRTVVEKTKHRT